MAQWTMEDRNMLRTSRLLSLVAAFVVISISSAMVVFRGTPEVVFEQPAFQEASSSVIAAAVSARSATSIAAASSVVPVHASSLPRSVTIKMAFSPQAPHANWDQLHQEACEEMSLLLVHHYLAGTPLSGPAQAESELQDIIKWHREHGYIDDVTVSELGEIAEQYFGYTPRILEDVTADDIRSELAKGNPVIIPAAGRLLGNPYFTGEGPWYHMLVVKGYEGKTFITNDVGTRRGEGYRYNEEVLINAIHDWTGVKEETAQGAKRALVLLRDK